MATKKFKEFNLLFRIIFFNCGFVDDISFLGGDLFNHDGYFILSETEEIFHSKRNCKNCSNFCYTKFKKILLQVKVRELYDELQKNIENKSCKSHDSVKFV